MYKARYYLLAILLIAGVLRFFQIGSIPPSLTWDEVSWGYNAYVLGIDGKDEFGKFLPLSYLESFGDFKPPLYAYLDIIPVKIFGLTEFATRFPSAFFGTAAVLLTYFTVKEIFGTKREGLALLSSLILAISPWHIMLSRAAFEANVAQFFILLGILTFLLSVRSNKLFLLLSSISFVASMYTFNSARIVAPILVIVLLFSFWKTLIKYPKTVISSGLLGVILFLPLLLFINTPQAKLRFNEVNIFSDIKVIERINQQVENDSSSILSKTVHNRRFAYGVEYLRHYFDNFNPAFLFIKGDGNPKFSIQDVGQLYLWEIPFFIAGILILFRKREGYWWIVPVVIFVGILPAGFARETPHALRIENALPMFQIITALGVIYLVGKLKKYRKFAVGLISFLILLNFTYFIHNYLTHYSREFSGEWQYGYKESIDFASKNSGSYDKIYVTTALGRPYIYYLFYLKYDPKTFRSEADIYREPLGFVHVNSFSNFEFADDLGEINEPHSLYIALPREIPDNAEIVKEFKLLNGEIQLVAYTL